MIYRHRDSTHPSRQKPCHLLSQEKADKIYAFVRTEHCFAVDDKWVVEGADPYRI